mmetsp:Transcript_19770/g.54986  ORF Transcript_19770/g.54986 Transcript_19770/m.54986 type:complete len:217 (-) Transcript_19770:819-1469(-)|eukprot:CAMPEP_0198134896 /NCGR_PEP_ID=MMETSP1442-20131203/60312_1 /TAXON_ID= /ORGANISM="Craspedostauros australis, Strain CCMP3328" /LENGTH=216 /DNA_ID=CAMNT_0043796053 /DNA_START=1263 /DNA_END=1913 /DNA_ORIENTATION=+
MTVAAPILHNSTMSSGFTQTGNAASLASAEAAEAALLKPKPALVKDKTRKKDPKELTWDEVAIEEHDQLRGTRMKIEEPNTPYHHHSYDSGSETDGSHSGRREMRMKESPTNRGHPTISWDTLQNKLDSVAAVREQYPSSPSSQGMAAAGSGEEGEMDLESDKMEGVDKQRTEMKKLEFQEHRKRHYNEMELVRKWRQEHPDGGMGDDENDADDET